MNNIDQNNRLMDKLNAAIIATPGINRTKLIRQNQTVRACEINAVLATMEKGGMIYRKTHSYVGTGGRTAELWYPTRKDASCSSCG